MRDLKRPGALVVQHPPAPPTPVDIIETWARRQQRRRNGLRDGRGPRPRSVVLAGAAAIVVDRRESSPARHADLATTEAWGSSSGEHGPTARNLGVGVPKGWMPVDYGDAALRVRPIWDVTAGGCASPSAPE